MIIQFLACVNCFELGNELHFMYFSEYLLVGIPLCCVLKVSYPDSVIVTSFQKCHILGSQANFNYSMVIP